MPELLGVLLALVIAGLAWGIWRALSGLGRRARDLLVTAHALLRPGAARRPKPDRGQRRRLLQGLRMRAARALARAESERATALASELARLRTQLRLTERERDQLRHQLARARPAPLPAMDDRFHRAKRAFAMHFHPDRITATGLERMLRVNMFKSFWTELRRIERG